jgi:hypothetical protein
LLYACIAQFCNWWTGEAHIAGVEGPDRQVYRNISDAFNRKVYGADFGYVVSPAPHQSSTYTSTELLQPCQVDASVGTAPPSVSSRKASPLPCAGLQAVGAATSHSSLVYVSEAELVPFYSRPFPGPRGAFKPPQYCTAAENAAPKRCRPSPEAQSASQLPILCVSSPPANSQLEISLDSSSTAQLQRQQHIFSPSLTDAEDVPSLQNLESEFPDNGLGLSLMQLSPSSSSMKEIAMTSAAEVSATTQLSPSDSPS